MEWYVDECLPSIHFKAIHKNIYVWISLCWCDHQIECRSHFDVFHLITTWTSNHGNKIQMNQKFHRKQIYSIEICFFFSISLFSWFWCPSFDSFVRSFSMKWDRKQKRRNSHYNMAFVTTICTLVWVLLSSDSKWELMWCNQGTVIHSKSLLNNCALWPIHSFILAFYMHCQHTFMLAVLHSSSIFLLVCMYATWLCGGSTLYNGKIRPATIICCIHRPNFIKHLNS